MGMLCWKGPGQAAEPCVNAGAPQPPLAAAGTGPSHSPAAEDGRMGEGACLVLRPRLGRGAGLRVALHLQQVAWRAFRSC